MSTGTGPDAPTGSVLVLNSGSSSLKYQLIDVATESSLADGAVERIGEAGSSTGEGVADHTQALRQVFAQFAEHGPDLDAVGLLAIGHRVVHGGERSAPAVISPDVLAEIEGLSVLAPLHNPAAAQGIRAAQQLRPDLPHVAVFDTAFFATLPPAAHTYAIDREVAAEHRIRRYGFHGTSHGWVSTRAAELVGRPYAELRQIVLHLGNGASVSAVDGGTPIDTSMGLTPLEGLVMGTRSGDLDPAILLTLARAGWTTDQIDTLLNKRSGLLGLAGVNDFRALLERLDAGDEDARLAFDVYVHRLVRYVGAYHALLGGAELLTFTAGVGQHSPRLRAAVLDRLAPLGFVLDAAANDAPGRDARIISTPDSTVAVAVVPTDEELAIARACLEVLR